MLESAIQQVRESLDAIYRAESGRILATLIRLPGDADRVVGQSFAEILAEGKTKELLLPEA